MRDKLKIWLKAAVEIFCTRPSFETSSFSLRRPGGSPRTPLSPLCLSQALVLVERRIILF